LINNSQGNKIPTTKILSLGAVVANTLALPLNAALQIGNELNSIVGATNEPSE